MQFHKPRKYTHVQMITYKNSLDLFVVSHAVIFTPIHKLFIPMLYVKNAKRLIVVNAILEL